MISKSSKRLFLKVLHIFLIFTIILPLLPRPGLTMPLRQNNDSGATLEEAFGLLETAKAENYLPSAFEAFDNPRAQSRSALPVEPLANIPTSPWEMLPQSPHTGGMGSNGADFSLPTVPDPNGENQAVLDSFMQRVGDLEGQEGQAETESSAAASQATPEPPQEQEIAAVPATLTSASPTPDATATPITAKQEIYIAPVQSTPTAQARATEVATVPPRPTSYADVIAGGGGNYQSPDKQLSLFVPQEVIYEPVRFTYTKGASNLPARASLSEEVHNSYALFTLAAHQVSDHKPVERLRRPLELHLQYDDSEMAEQQEKYLRLRAYHEASGEWIPLPTAVDSENNTITALSVQLTTFALLMPFEPEEPCAIGVELVSDTDFPFTTAPTDNDGDPIPQGNFLPLTGFVDNFPNYVGTEIYVSGTDTGDLQETDPTAAEPTEAKDRVRMVFPLDDVEHTNDGQVPPDDVTALFPPNPMITLPDDTEVEERVFDRTVNIELEHTADDPQWGSTGYYLVRKDVTNPIIIQFYTYHDGEGGVNLYVEAYDHCAIGEVSLTYSNSTGGGGTTTFEYQGSETDGLGLYLAQIQLPTTGLNTYTVLVEDMADYDGPNSVTAIYSEQASNSAGYGSAELIGKSVTCSNKCGCDAACGSAGDPINTASGNFTMSVNDITIPGIGDTDIEILRSYNSLGSERYYAFIGAPREPISNFGLGWTSSFQFEIEAVDPLPLVGPGIKVNYPDGHSTRYAGTTGTLTPLTPGESNDIVRTGNTFILTDKETLTEYHFELILDPTNPVNRAPLVQKIDANGNTITYTPGADGPTQITNSAGRTINLTYNGEGLITQITGPEGLSLSYGYSGLLLTSFTDERGQTSTYSYDGSNHLTQVTTPKGHPSLQLSYYGDGRVESQTVGEAESYTISYDDGAYRRTITDGNGKPEIQQYDVDYRLLSTTDARGFIDTYSYTAANVRETLNDKNGHDYTYTYDARHNLTRTDGPLGWSMQRTYNAQDKLLSMTDAEGRTTNFAYDGNGNLTSVTNAAGDSMSITYNGQGQATEITDFRGNSVVITYNGSGDIATMTNGEGETLTFVHDDLGRRTSMTTPDGSTFAFEYDEASNLLTQLQGPFSYKLEYDYDENRNLQSESDANGNPPTTHTYDTSENLTSTTDPLGSVMSYTYDNMNKMLSMSDELGRSTTYLYDESYNLIEIHAPENNDSIYTYDGMGNLLTMTDAEGRQTIYLYDELDRLSSATDALGGVVGFTYDLVGNIIAISDANGHLTDLTYNSRDLLIELENAEDEATTYDYDANGNLTSIVDGNGNPSSLTYDATNRLESVTNAEDETSTFDYNGMSNMTDITQPNGVMIHLVYDELYRMTQMVNNYVAGSPSDAETNITHQFAYDLNGNATAVTDPAGDLHTYQYDALNRTRQETNELGDTQLYEYDAVSNLLSMTDWRGYKTTFAFDEADRLIQITDPLTGTKLFQYDRVSNLTQYTDENGHTTTFSYDALNRPISKSDPERNVTQYGYDAVGNLTELTDANTHLTTLVYDQVNRPITLTNAAGGITLWQYDEEGNVILETDPNGHATTIGYDNAYRVTSITDAEGYLTTFEYDLNSNVTRYTDGNGNAAEYSYDPLDRLIEVTNAEAEIIRYSYDEMGNLIDFTAPHGIVTHYEYDGLFSPTSVTFNYLPASGSDSDTNVAYLLAYDANGNLIDYVDPEGNPDSFVYDALNRPIEYSNALSQTESYQYDGVGNLRFFTNRRGYITEYEYDGADRLIEMTDALNGSSLFAYDGVGNLTDYTDANGHLTQFDYDEIDRLSSITNPEGHSAYFTYDPVGNITQFTNPRGYSTTYAYDDINRLISVTDALAGVMQFEYDALTNITQLIDQNGHATTITYDNIYRETTITDAEGYIERYDYDLNSNITEMVNGNGNATEYSYDALDRVTSVRNVLNQSDSYTYDRVGNLIDIIEADGVVTHYGYDAIYNMTSVTLNHISGGTTTVDTNVLYQYAYDANDNLTQITDPRHNPTTFAYDALDRLSEESNPLGNSWAFSYDAVGNLIERIDANGHTTDYSYYPDDELQTIDYDDGTSVTYTYDQNNNPITMLDSLGNSSFSYDELDRLSTSTDALGRSLAYGYDPVSNLTTINYPNGGSIQYDYYNNDWLETVTDTAGGATTYERNGVGQRTRMVQPNGAISEFAYDNAERLVAIRHTEGTGELIASFEYELDQVGQRTEAAIAYGRPWPRTLNETYQYDPLRRLTSISDSDGFAASYDYDAAGNRKRWTANDDQMTPETGDGFDITYNYNSANQLESESNGDESTSYTYDNKGNLVNSEWSKTDFAYRYGTDYSYDREDRLTNSTNYRINDSLATGHRRHIEGNTLFYFYDGIGRRLAKEYIEQDGRGRLSRTEYVFDGMDTVAEYPVWEEGEPAGRNNHRNEFYFDDSNEIVSQRRFPNGVPDQNYWYHYDGSKNVVSLTETTDRAWVHYRYDSYGQQLPEWGNIPHPEYHSHNTYGVAGKEWDESLKMYHFGARLYDPANARWPTQDLFRGFIEQPNTLNRYAYLTGDPVNQYDFYGFWGRPSWDDFKNAGSNIVDKGKDSVVNNVNETKNKVVNATSEFVKDPIGNTQRLANQAWDTTKQLASDAWDFANLI